MITCRKEDRLCSKCKGRGHYSKDCKKEPKSTFKNQFPRNASSSHRRYDTFVPPDKFLKRSSSYCGKDRQTKSADANMKYKPRHLSNVRIALRKFSSKDVAIKAKQERNHKEERNCMSKLTIQYESIGSYQKHNEEEVKVQKNKKNQRTQAKSQEALNSGNTLQEVNPTSHENMFENRGGSIEVHVPSRSEVAEISEVNKVTSEDMEKLKHENEELRIQLAIRDTELELAELRRSCVIDDICLLNNYTDVENFRKKYPKY